MTNLKEKLVIIIVEYWYHPDAPGYKAKMTEFYDLQKAEEYYLRAKIDDGMYAHTTINIYMKEVKDEGI